MMKIRKKYMVLCGTLFAAQAIRAQQNMLLFDNNGCVNAVAASSVNHVTFNASDKWFSITNDGVEGTKNNLITAVCTFGLPADSEVKSLSVAFEVGVCYSKNNAVPTIKDDCLFLGSELKSYTFTLKSLEAGTDYFFRPYMKLGSVIFYGDVASAKTLGAKQTDSSKTLKIHRR